MPTCPFGQLLYDAAIRRNIGYEEVIQLLNAAGNAAGMKGISYTRTSFTRWLTGTIPPAKTQRLLGEVLGIPVDKLATVANKQREDRRTLTVELSEQSARDLIDETLALVHGILSPKVDPGAVASIENATYNLGRLYPKEPPSRVLPQVHQQFRLAHAALKSGPTLRDHPRLLTVAGWHCLLLAMLHYDLANYQAAHIARDTALSLGQQVGDGDIVGWAFETAAWFAIYDGSPQHVVDAAEEGVRQSPANSAAQVMNVLKMGIGWARLGRALEAQRAIEQADAIIPQLPSVSHPDYHFAFDQFKLNLYAARIYAFLNLPTEAETTGSPRNRECHTVARID